MIVSHLKGRDLGMQEGCKFDAKVAKCLGWKVKDESVYINERVGGLA